MKTKCQCCKIQNCYDELMRHPSESALRTLECAWKTFTAALEPGADMSPTILGILVCPVGHGNRLDEWHDSIKPKLRWLATEGIVLRRRKAKIVNQTRPREHHNAL